MDVFFLLFALQVTFSTALTQKEIGLCSERSKLYVQWIKPYSGWYYWYDRRRSLIRYPPLGIFTFHKCHYYELYNNATHWILQKCTHYYDYTLLFSVPKEGSNPAEIRVKADIIMDPFNHPDSQYICPNERPSFDIRPRFFSGNSKRQRRDIEKSDKDGNDNDKDLFFLQLLRKKRSTFNPACYTNKKIQNLNINMTLYEPGKKVYCQERCQCLKVRAEGELDKNSRELAFEGVNNEKKRELVYVYLYRRDVMTHCSRSPYRDSNFTSWVAEEYLSANCDNYIRSYRSFNTWVADFYQFDGNEFSTGDASPCIEKLPPPPLQTWQVYEIIPKGYEGHNKTFGSKTYRLTKSQTFRLTCMCTCQTINVILYADNYNETITFNRVDTIDNVSTSVISAIKRNIDGNIEMKSKLNIISESNWSTDYYVSDNGTLFYHNSITHFWEIDYIYPVNCTKYISNLSDQCINNNDYYETWELNQLCSKNKNNFDSMSVSCTKHDYEVQINF